MTMKEYFAQHEGTGVLSTSDAAGNVDAAIYARPGVLDDHSVVFVMADRLSYRNLQSNPHAVFLFMEKEGHYGGKRLYLTRKSEESDLAKVEEAQQKFYPHHKEMYKDVKKFLVTFSVDKCLPLLGEGKDQECFLVSN